MRRVPPKLLEALVALFLPPASREEVLGDLHERCTSTAQYAVDALRTVPLVILSRILRTADAQVVLMEAFLLYLSFLGAAWYKDSALLQENWGLLRLALPAAAALTALILEDAYLRPGAQSRWSPMRGSVLGVSAVFLSQAVLSTGSPALALPVWIRYAGGALSLVLVSAIRMLFPPVASRLHSAGVPTFWLKQSPEPVGRTAWLTALVVGAGLACAAALLLFVVNRTR